MRCVVVGYDDNWWGNNGDPHASPILEMSMFTVAREIYLIIFILLSTFICMNNEYTSHECLSNSKSLSDLFGCWFCAE